MNAAFLFLCQIIIFVAYVGLNLKMLLMMEKDIHGTYTPSWSLTGLVLGVAHYFGPSPKSYHIKLQPNTMRDTICDYILMITQLCIDFCLTQYMSYYEGLTSMVTYKNALLVTAAAIYLYRFPNRVKV